MEQHDQLQRRLEKSSLMVNTKKKVFLSFYRAELGLGVGQLGQQIVEAVFGVPPLLPHITDSTNAEIIENFGHVRLWKYQSPHITTAAIFN